MVWHRLRKILVPFVSCGNHPASHLYIYIIFAIGWRLHPLGIRWIIYFYFDYYSKAN